MGKLEGDFYLPVHPPTLMDSGGTGTHPIYPFQAIGYAIRATGWAEKGKWDRKAILRLTSGAKKILHRFAGEAALGRKKTPTVSGVQKLNKYFIRKLVNVNPCRRIFWKNLFEVNLGWGLRGPMPSFGPGRNNEKRARSFSVRNS
jgi:hypothetical protein